MKPKGIGEAKFLQMVIQAAQATGWLVSHQRPGLNRRGKWQTAVQGNVGFPDLCMVHEKTGRVIFAELKSDTGKVSPDQERWSVALSKHQPIGMFLWRPLDWPAIEAELKRP